MMNTLINKRLGIIVKLAEQKPGLGKTAMMKYVYLLQEVYDVPLKYNFEIYTYGPYSSAVMEDIDAATHNQAIKKEVCYYPNAIGYMIKPAENADQYLAKERDFINKYKHQIHTVIKLFGDKTAKELELISTTTYIFKLAEKNKWSTDIEEISESVHEIKPHFSFDEIAEAFSMLKNNSVIS